MSKQEPIHSGHFMTSNPHTEIQQDDEDEDVEVDVVDVDEGVSTVQLDKNTAKEKDGEKPVTFYKFGPQKTQSIAIDVSLNKLNKCIRVAYMKMTTPKWKDFKGLKLQWKHRIRLNNVIWRAYYMEFRKPKPGRKRKAPYCYFSVPDDDTTHTKIEGSVMEGMYWKRRMEAVCAQYKRWRGYNSKKKRCCRKRENSCGCELLTPNLLNKGYRNQLQPNYQQRSLTPENLSTMNNGPLFDFDDDFDDEFTSQLFEQLNAPFLFPNPREGAAQCANADIMQPGLLSLQPSLEEIMSTDYPFLGTDEFVDSEFSNPMPMPASTSSTQRYSNGPGKLITSATSQHNTKEYDTFDMLRNYTNQPLHQRSTQLQQQQSQQLSPTSNLRRKLTPPQNFQQIRQNPMNPQSQLISKMPLTPVLTPNVSTPFYSIASVYEPQKLAGIGIGQRSTTGARSTTSAMQSTTGYGSVRPPSMLTKTANLTSITHPITSMASSAHSSPFLPASIDYSLLIAASSSALTQVVGQSTITASPLAKQQQQSQWLPSWFSQQPIQPQQQSIYQPTPTQQRNQTQFIRKSSGTTIQQNSSAQDQIRQISPLALSANSFNTQFPFSSTTESFTPISPYTTSFANLVSNAPSQPTQLLQSLDSATPQTSVRQFVMSDLSRYLTQQQSTIGVNTNSGFVIVTNTPSIISNLSVNTSPLATNNVINGLSPVTTTQYTPVTISNTPLLMGAYNNSGSNNSNINLTNQSRGDQSQTQSQQVQQHPQCTSAGAIDLMQPSSSIQIPIRSQKKMSASDLPLSNGSISIQKQQFLSKNSRASFSSTRNPTNLGKRQMQQQTEISAGRQQQQLLLDPLETTSFVELQSPPKISRRWSSSSRRQHSIDSPKFQQQQLATPFLPLPGQQQQPTATLSQLPHRKGQSLSGVKEFINEQPQQKTTLLANESDIGRKDENCTLMTLGLQKQSTVKAEESIEEKPALLFATMSHKRRHQQQHNQSSSSSPTSASNADASTSNSAPADSTLHPEERKRILHLNAEKNRRTALKDGFESLVSVIPMVEQAGVKSTNAVLLNRAAQHIRGLKVHEGKQEKEIEELRQKIANMNERIALIQSNLPSSSSESKAVGEGTTSPSMRIQVEQFFDRYKRERSHEDYRFWLMAEVLKPVACSYAQQIHPDETNHDKVLSSARQWLESNWNATTLRPIASDMLVKIATASGAFTNEKALSQYIEQQVSKQEVPPSSVSLQHSQQQQP